MKKILLIVFSVISICGFSQVKYSSDYAFDKYCFQGGTGNFIPVVSLSNDTKFTLECMAYKQQTTDFVAIGGGGSVVTNRLLIFWNTDNSIYIGVENGQNSYGKTPAIASGQWINIYCIYDGSQADNLTRLKIYINGEAQSLTFLNTIPASFAVHVNNFAIGRITTNTSTYVYSSINTLINNVKIWKNQAITYENRNTTTPTCYHPLCEGYGATAYDVSGNGNNGTISGSNYWATCASQTYPETYGITKVVYGGFTAYIPYLLSGTPIYNHASPVINAAERYKNYPASFWGAKYAVKIGNKLIKQ